MAKGKLSGMQGSGMQRTTKRKKEEEQEQQKQQPKQEQPRPAAKQSKASEPAASAQKTETGSKAKSTGSQQTWQRRAPMRYQRPERSTVDALHETIGLTNEPEKLPNYISSGKEPAKPEKLSYRPAESTATVKPLSYSPYAGTAADVRQFTDSGSGTVKKPEAKPEEKKSGFASFSQDEEADAGVEEQPDEPKQTGAAPANTALDDYLSGQEALREANKAGQEKPAQSQQDPQAQKEQLKQEREALAAEYNDLKYRFMNGKIWAGEGAPPETGVWYTPEEAQQMETMETQLRDYDERIAALQADVNAGEALGTNIMAGLENAGYGVTQALDWLGGEKSAPWWMAKEVGTLFGIDLEGKNPITKLKEQGAEEVEYWKNRGAEAVEGNDAWEGVGQHAQSIAQSAPFIILNLMTLGSAGGAAASTEGLEYISSLFQSSGMQGVSTMAAHGLQALASNPSAQYSFATTFGSSYDDALKDGATPAEATLYAVLNGTYNAMIEVGGADEALGGMQALPAEVKQAIASGDKNFVLNYIKSIAGEINEEEWQGMIERGLKSIYTDVPLYSNEDPNAIINPQVMLDTAKNTAIDTALMSGAQMGAQYGLDALANAGQNNAAPLDPTQVLAEQVTGQVAPVEGPSAEDQRAEQRAQRAAEAPAEVKAQADEVVDALLGPMADAQAKADAAERVEEILTTPTEEATEAPQESAELPGDIPAPPTAAESTTAQSEEFNREVPPARATTTAKAAADSLAESVGIEDRGGRLAAGLQEIADYIQSNNNGNGINEEELRAKAEKLAADTLDAIPGQETGDRELYDGIRSMLDGRGFEISDELRGDVADYNAWRKSLFGKLSLVKNGESIDTLYAELGTTFGKSLFPDDITSHADQINRIVDVLEGTRPQQTSFTDEVSQEDYDAALAELTQQVLDSAEGIESTATALSDESLSSLEENAPPVTIGGTPVTPSAAQANGPTVERGFAENVRTTGSTEAKLAESLGEEKATYQQLVNKDVLARAQEIFDGGLESAQRELYTAISSAKAGAKLAPEMVPLARMVANELTRAGNVAEAHQIISDVAAELTAAGQLGQVAKILRNTDPVTVEQTISKMIDTINRDYAEAHHFGKAKNWRASLTKSEIETIHNTDFTQDGAFEQVWSDIATRLGQEMPATFREKLHEFRRINMLLRPRTQIKNVLSNVPMVGMRKAAETFSGAIQDALVASGAMDKAQQTRTAKVGSGSRTLANDYFNGHKDAILSEGNKFDMNKVLRDHRTYFKGGAIEKAASKLTGKELGSFMEAARRTTYDLLERGDAPFVRSAFVDNLAQYCAAQGITSAEGITQDAVDFAMANAMEATFKAENAVANIINRAKKIPGAGDLIDVVFPFTTTPANITSLMLKYSPVGYITTAVQGLKGADINTIVDNASKATVGSGIFALGLLLRSLGYITGAPDDDKDKAAFDKANGISPYSIGGKWSYDWIQPVGSLLALGAEMHDSLENSDETFLTALINSMYSAGDSVLDMSLFQNISSILSANGSKTENILKGVVEGAGTQLVPGLLQDIAKIADGTVRSTYTGGNVLQNTAAKMMAGIPGLSQKLPASVNVMGEDMSRGPLAWRAVDALLNPGTTNHNKSSETAQEIYALYEATGDPAVFPDSAPYKVGKERMTGEERAEYQRTMGQSYMDNLDSIFGDSLWKRSSDAEKSKVAEKLKGYAADEAKREYAKEHGKAYSSDYDDEFAVVKAGVDLGQYLLEKQNANQDGKGSLSLDELYGWLSGSDYTDKQKAVIWNANKGASKKSWQDYNSGRPETIIAGTGKTPEEAKKIADAIDAMDKANGSITQGEIKAYYKSHKGDEDMLRALWDAMGWKTSFDKGVKK